MGQLTTDIEGTVLIEKFPPMSVVSCPMSNVKFTLPNYPVTNLPNDSALENTLEIDPIKGYKEALTPGGASTCPGKA
jgi:hypothetical protein